MLDSPEGGKSTANSLLAPFGLTVKPPGNAPARGPLTVWAGWPAPTVGAACQVEGGTTAASLGGLPVAAFARYGKGRHRAGLNLGDCFAYALAKSTGEPLLYKGNDFSRTDVASA